MSAASLEWSTGRALAAGATADEIADVLLVIAPVAGLGRVVRAAPDVAIALGYDIEAAVEEPGGLRRFPIPQLAVSACQRAGGRTVKISSDFDAAVIAKDAGGDAQNGGPAGPAWGQSQAPVSLLRPGCWPSHSAYDLD